MTSERTIARCGDYFFAEEADEVQGATMSATYTPEQIIAIAESQTFDEWGQGDYILSGHRFCRLGWIADKTGMDWEQPYLCEDHLFSIGLTRDQIEDVIRYNDEQIYSEEAFANSLHALKMVLGVHR